MIRAGENCLVGSNICCIIRGPEFKSPSTHARKMTMCICNPTEGQKGDHRGHSLPV